MKYEYCVIGGGIVGLSVAMHILKARPANSLLLIEKESQLGKHQTSHNSGVVHAGIYYKPGSLKAVLCKEGLVKTKKFCEEHQISYDKCGKLIVATDDVEETHLKSLYQRSKKNGLSLSYLEKSQLREIEPNITGKAALLSPETAIVDYKKIALKIGEIIKELGGEIQLNESVKKIKEGPSKISIHTDKAIYSAKKLIVCAGLQADRLAKQSGMEIDYKIIPFRGEYYQLPKAKQNAVKHLIYPVPDPNLPFLGIHLTKMIDGKITVGPNAVLGFAREKYPKFSFDMKDMLSYTAFPGFWRLLWNERKSVFQELETSMLKKIYLRKCQKYYPDLDLDDLQEGYAGIRAQLVNKKGELIHDFEFVETSKMLHVLNAPSPAATSSLPIGRMIAEKIL